MPDLEFRIEAVEVVPLAVAPLLAFKLRIDNLTAEPIQTVMLRCQIQLEVTRRSYTRPEQKRLVDLFGQPEMWGRSLRSMLWTNTSEIVPAFTGSTDVRLPVTCTFDFNVAATKYFAGIDDGDVPLCLLFSGTIFYVNTGGALQVCQIPWEKEAHYRLPIRIWQDMMELYYPEAAWLCLRRDVFRRLYEYKTRRGLPTWEEAIASALAETDRHVGDDLSKEAQRQ